MSKKPKPPKRKKPRFIRKRQAPTFTPADAAVFDSVTPPDGMSYQWIAVEELPKIFRGVNQGGWWEVAPEAHPNLPTEDGRIVYLGNCLIQRSAESASAVLNGAQRAAIKQLEDHPAYIPRNGRGKIAILPESFVVSHVYDRIPDNSPDTVVQLMIPFRLSARYQDVASALGLSVQEYAQRRLGLHLDGQLAGLLMPADGAFALVEQSFSWKRDDG